MSFKLRLQLSFTCSSAADKLRFILSVFTSVQSKFSCFFFCCCFFFVVFTSESGNLLKYMKKYPFLVFSGATDGNFTEKYSIEP